MKPLLAAMVISTLSLGCEGIAQYWFNLEPAAPLFSTAAQIDDKGRSFCLDPHWRAVRHWCELDRRVPWFQYPTSEYVPPGATSAKWNETGSAVCPERSDYAGDLMCVPR
jgi:hypothetical protein